ncbi:MAG: metal ABC transporter permease [Pseudomonadales bacterium]|nr:metal ABC transporter permease [Pseudomonadales bacterium]
MIDMLWVPVCAGVLLAIIAGPLGSFIVWQRMAYFGESLAHASLLGVALGVFYQQPALLSTVISCVGVAVFLGLLQKRVNVSINTLLGIVAHSLLALGLVVSSLLPGGQINLEALLFGDLLMLDQGSLMVLLVVVLVVLLYVSVYWKALLNIAVDENLARIEGIPVDRLQCITLILLATAIAVFIHAVGLLLIVSLLIIPAATAQGFCRTPLQMVLMSSILCLLAVAGGMCLSWEADTPAGPSVVIFAGALFFLSITIKQIMTVKQHKREDIQY